MERHWAVQHDAVLYPLVRYDFIGKQESLVEDLLKLEALLFGKRGLRPRRARLGQQGADADRLRPPGCASTTPIAIAAKVAERYALDFDTFGYSRDLADAR